MTAEYVDVKYVSEEEKESAPPRQIEGELNIFVRTPDGFDAHIKLNVFDAKKAASILTSTSTFLAEHNYTRNERYGGKPAASGPMPFEEDAKPRKNGKAATQKLPAPDCEFCGGEVWDNRGNKRNPKAPDFKCKDKDECGAAGWVNADGSIKWSNPL